MRKASQQWLLGLACAALAAPVIFPDFRVIIPYCSHDPPR
jgi:hypothetical protein